MQSDINEKNVTEVVIAELKEALARIDTEEISNAVELISDSERIFCAGAGRSALGIGGFAMRLMHMGKKSHVVGEATTPGISAGDLLVIGSGSGQTGSLVSMAKKAKGIGARILLITIDSNSPIGQLADSVIRISTPSPKVVGVQAADQSIQPMGSLFEQALFILFDCLVLLLM